MVIFFFFFLFFFFYSRSSGNPKICCGDFNDLKNILVDGCPRSSSPHTIKFFFFSIQNAMAFCMENKKFSSKLLEFFFLCVFCICVVFDRKRKKKKKEKKKEKKKKKDNRVGHQLNEPRTFNFFFYKLFFIFHKT